MSDPVASPVVRPVAPRAITGPARLLAVFAAGLIRAWGASLRLSPAPGLAERLNGNGAPTLFVLWHDRLFVASEMSRHLRFSRPLHVLVSASKDGAWLTAVFELAGLAVVRGSSSRGGREAVLALIDVLRAGRDVGLTPDGPRGPARVFKPGALVVARRARARVVLLGIHYEAAWRVRSWDRLALPHPFSRVVVHAEAASAETLAAPDALARLEARLNAINRDSASSAPVMI